MLNHPTLDKLKQLKSYGMAQGLQEQVQHPAIEQLGFEERLGLLVDREMTHRMDLRLNPTSSPNNEVPCHFNPLTILTAVGWHYGFFAVHEGFAFAERVGFDA